MPAHSDVTHSSAFRAAKESVFANRKITLIPTSPRRWLTNLVFLAVILASTGCQRRLRTSYGSSTGILAKQSVNGFTTFRQAFDTAGFSHRDVNRLTNRVRRASVLVWTPTHPTGIEIATTRWLERWLRIGNKTLIYVVPDSGSETAFYREARPFAAPDQRLEYRRKYAESLISEHQWQLQRTALQSNGWFSLRPKVQRTRTEGAAASESTQWNEHVADSAPRQFEWVIEEFDKDANQQGTQITATVGPGSTPWGGIGVVSPTTTEVEFRSLVQSSNGDALVASVTSKRWNGSQILIVAGGSLLTNYGLTHADNQRLADQLIDDSLQTLVNGGVIDSQSHLMANGSEPQVGFATADGAFPISELNAEIPRASGAEILTVFPISFVTIHIALLGFVFCLMLMPVFGRPRPINRAVLTHFGDHLDAVATLMRRRGGEAFAKRRISDYMKHVRDETSGPWVMDEPQPQPARPSDLSQQTVSSHSPDRG